MTRPYLGNPKYTIEVLQKYGFVFQKRFGQNFLIDTRVLDRIIEASEITKDDFVLEIGPGIGTMTQYLADAAREVTAVEIDDALIPILQDTLKEWDNVSVIHGDILKTDIRKIADEKNQGRPIKVVANLPYYITTPIIMGLFESHVPVDSITVMVQKEVADRMQTGPGSKDYGALSRRSAKLLFNSGQHSVYHRGISENNAASHAIHRIFSYYLLRRVKADPRKLGRVGTHAV